MMMGGGFPGFLAVLVTFVAIFIARRVIRSRARDRARSSEVASMETRIYRLADKRGGRLTVSDVVVQLGIPSAEAEKELNRLSDGLRVRMNVEDDGMIVYEFAELQKRKRVEAPK